MTLQKGDRVTFRHLDEDFYGTVQSITVTESITYRTAEGWSEDVPVNELFARVLVDDGRTFGARPALFVRCDG